MRFRFTAVTGILLLASAGCAATPSAPPSPANETVGDGHGEIAGAHELSEPALHLTTVDADGAVDHLDLLDEETETLAEIEPIEELVSDGRYLFGIRDGSVTVVDSGVWTWSHIDHFHYYEAPSRVIGEIEGSGLATVVTGDVGTGIQFDDEAVLIDTLALADGEIVEEFRLPVEPHAGLIVPLAEGAVITEPDADGAPQTLRVVDAEGAPGESIACSNAAGTITTVVGVVIGCADGAALSVGGDPSDWERIAYPADAAPPVTEFAGREGRPSVAALAGPTGVWLLDTRERNWTFQNVGEEIVRVAAVSDDADRVLALTASGSVLVLAGGEVVSRTEPLVAASVADPELAAGVTFVVDQNRAYLNGPAEQALWEIDPADAARIARTFETVTMPFHLAGTGR
ncbi:hypothetical protein [Microbacterium murale]|uniref:ABC transporter n=1 Tax=Microbacterium murale TaxID=1081040 RepID=A0ABU0P836_9MICO|nr:hypothetical protein [Microbacterium murale]MDQ0642851.1 hypothetical protein [Microbacterium murale]